MKRLLYAVMLLLGMGIMASCEKEEGKASINDIEGRWYTAVKWERLLNGTVVYSSTDFDEATYPIHNVSRVMFQNGNVNVVDTYGDSRVWPYTYSEGVLTVFGEEFKVVKATKQELVGDSSFGAADCDGKHKVLLTTYKGVDIYYEYQQGSSGWEMKGFYYYDKQGNAKFCYYESDNSFNQSFEFAELYDESLKAYVGRIKSFNVDYFFDTDRFYLKAE